MVWIEAVVRVMREHQRGRIINVSSPGASVPLPHISSCAAAKAGLSQLTACIAPELEADGIVVVAIGPAALSDMTRTLWETDGLPAAGCDASEQVEAETIGRRRPRGLLGSL